MLIGVPHAWSVAIVLSAALGVLVLSMGPIVPVVAFCAFVTGVAILMSPLIGLVLTIFANTSFQILGSGHTIGLPVSASQLLAAMTLGSWLIRVFLNRTKLVASPQWRSVMAILIMIIVWDALASANTSPFQGSIRFATVFALYVLVANIAAHHERDLTVVIASLFAAMSLCGVIGTAEHFMPALAIESDDPELAKGAVGAVLDRESLEGVVIKRITGGLGDANWLSYSIAAVMPLGLYFWDRYRSLLARSIVAAALALQMLGMVLSYTRTGFLGLGVAVAYLVLRRALPIKYILMGTLALGAAALVYLPPGLVDRFFSSSYLAQGSTPLRELLVTRATRIWLEAPIVGHGYAGFGQRFHDSVQVDLPSDVRLHAWADDLALSISEGRELVENIGAHNLFLEILVEYGLIGFFVFTMFIVLVFRDLSWVERNGSRQQRIMALCIKAGFFAFLTCGILGHAKFLKVPWMLAGVSVALRVVVGEQQKNLGPKFPTIS